MLKKVLLSAIVILLFITACNKGFNDVHGVTNVSKSMVFTVSSSVPVNIDINVLRKVGNGFITVETFHAVNAATPYTLSSTKTESGDVVNINIVNTVNKPTTASLKIAGVDIPVTSEGLKSNTQSTLPDLYYQLWSAVIP